MNRIAAGSSRRAWLMRVIPIEARASTMKSWVSFGGPSSFDTAHAVSD